MTLAHEQYLLDYWAYHSSLLRRKGRRRLHWGQREASEGFSCTNYEMEGHVPPAVDWVINPVANRLLRPEGILKIGAPVSWVPRTSQR
jgi:hypothetical protein